MRDLKSRTRIKNKLISAIEYIFNVYRSVGVLLPTLLFFAYVSMSVQWVFGHHYVVGEPSPQSYIALSELHYTDRAAMERLRDLAEQRVVAVVVKDGDKKHEFRVALQILGNISGMTAEVPINDFPQELFDAIINIPEPERDKILSYVEEIGENLYVTPRNEDDFLHPAEHIWNEVDKLNLPPDVGNIVYQILSNLLRINVKIDAQLTQEYRTQQRDNIPVIEKRIDVGYTIVERGQIITPQIAGLLRTQGYIGREMPFNSFVFCSSLILLLPFWLNIFVKKEPPLRRPLPWPFISLIIGASWVVEVLGSFLNVAGLGSWFLIISSHVVLTPYISFCISLSGNFISPFLVVGASYGRMGLLLFTGILSAVSGYYIMRNLVSRRVIMRQTMLLGIVFIAIDILVRWGINLPYSWITSVKLFAFGMLLSYIFSSSLSFIEGFMRITTTMRLREIYQTSMPLLKKLQIEIPGTYQHALTLGSLGETIAEELSLDANLMKAGAYYHDIGKLRRPLYYVENQINVGNIQDSLSAPLSAVTIIAHVKEGLELAAEYRLPACIRDFIAEHHGTTFLSYFYKKALAEGLNVSVEQFCYPGPKPQSRETALFMLLDSMEAGMRSSRQNIFSTADIEKVINRVFEMKLSEGQLDDVNFTFRDIVKIKKAMLKAFQSMYHTRKIKELQDKTQHS